MPLVLFSLLDGRIPVGAATLAGTAAALVVVAVMARKGVPVLPIVQAITLAVLSVIAFTGDAQTQHFLGDYGRGIASLVLAAYMLTTAPVAPFTATIARADVPREMWKSPHFIALNRKISSAWGAAVLVMGLAHLASAAAGSSLRPFQQHLLEWGPVIVAVLLALRYTRRTVADAQSARPAVPQPPRAY
ncbi:MAG TPA: hypothetical protein VG756_06855 [Pseudonocardiaceae bacterium]|nr:hypothetical protein [Pseudonocardiaceae bacterium]